MNNPADPSPAPRPLARGVPGRVLGALICAVFSAFAAQAREIPAPDARQPASPDWRDQILYFVMIDRFDDGDPRNNDQGAGEFDPADSGRYSGGDLAGIRRRLDYIRGLGASAVWITPPVRHQWWDESVRYGGYHGYWAQHFAEVDPHFGSLDDYRGLASGLHARGMYLVQDIVVNHTGNYFGYADGHQPGDPGQGFALNSGAVPTTAPTQWPFSANDARDREQRSLDIYHWTPAISDYTDAGQLLSGQMAGLDDLNTENPLVRRALRASYGYWIREVGVDAYRVDTAFYVPADYFRDFLHARDPHAPGIAQVARASGREDFLLFGEGFAVDKPFEDTQARRIETYARDAHGPLLPSMINFPLYGSTLDVFGRGRPPAELAHRIESMLTVHADPHRMPSFVDNHDVDRFLASGSEAGLRQALLLLMTLPGIPVIYYGTEQGFRDTRASMFASGWGSKGRDHFDEHSPGYQFLQRVTALRHAQPALRRGSPRVLAAEAAAAGALAYLTEHQGETLLTAFNSADASALLGALDTGLPAGTRLDPVFSIEEGAEALQVDAEGRIDLRLPARAGVVWKVEPGLSADAVATPRPELDLSGGLPVSSALQVRGRSEPGRALSLVINGDLDRALRLQADADGLFSATLDLNGLNSSPPAHRLQVLDLHTHRASLPQSFEAKTFWIETADVTDPSGDDHGPAGRYRYPSDPGWGERGLLDIRDVRVATSGGNLLLSVGLGDISQGWNPANGFDRVALTIYIELPDAEDGATLMPLQNDAVPAGMRWQRRLRVHGWSNVLTSAEGADARHEGRPVGAASIAVDTEARRISLSLRADALGNPQTLQGAKLLLTTWDFDNGYRAMSPEGGRMRFGGGDSRVDPLWMDALRIDLDP